MPGDLLSTSSDISQSIEIHKIDFLYDEYTIIGVYFIFSSWLTLFPRLPVIYILDVLNYMSFQCCWFCCRLFFMSAISWNKCHGVVGLVSILLLYFFSDFNTTDFQYFVTPYLCIEKHNLTCFLIDSLCLNAFSNYSKWISYIYAKCDDNNLINEVSLKSTRISSEGWFLMMI